MKSTYWNFPNLLHQWYNFNTNTTEAPTEVSEKAINTDEPEEKATADPQAQADSEDVEQSDQHEEEGDKSAIDSLPVKVEEESEKECEEPPVRTSSKSRKRHIFQEEEEYELEEQPFIPVLSRKGKEKVATPLASEDEAEQVDVELKA